MTNKLKMNSVKVISKTSSVVWQRFQTLKTQSLGRALRLRLYKSKLISADKPSSSLRRRWPRRVLLASAGLGTATVVVGINQVGAYWLDCFQQKSLMSSYIFQ